MTETKISVNHSVEYITLRDFFDTKIAAMEKAIEVAYEGMNRRLDGMNEFRQTLNEQGQTFLTKAEYEVFKSRVEEDIRLLRDFKSTLEGKASQSSVNNFMILSVISLILALVGIVLRLMGM